MQCLVNQKAMLLPMLASLFILASCGKSDIEKAAAGSDKATEARVESGKSSAESNAKGEKKDEHGGQGLLKLSEDEAKTAGIKLEELKPQLLVGQVELTATIRANQDRIAGNPPVKRW